MGLDAPSQDRIRLDGAGRRIAVIAARFNGRYCDALLDGAIEALVAHGVGRADIEVFRVPGAVEIPIALQQALVHREYDGAIAIGVVIRGGTPHFEYVCRAVTDGVMRVSLDVSTPVAFGVLTCDTEAQAAERSGVGDDNKGAESARALLETMAVCEQAKGGL